MANGVDCLSPRRGAVHPVPEAVDCVTGYVQWTIHSSLSVQTVTRILLSLRIYFHKIICGLVAYETTKM